MLGMAHEFAADGIACNSLWPKTIIATAAIANNFPEAALNAARHPAIVADAAHVILLRDSKTCSGNFFIDEEVLRAEGVTKFESYAVKPGTSLHPDIFL
jgi:citronellol/citronellal dehydrogenase